MPHVHPYEAVIRLHKHTTGEWQTAREILKAAFGSALTDGSFVSAQRFLRKMASIGLIQQRREDGVEQFRQWEAEAK